MTPKEQVKILKRGAVEMISAEELEAKLSRGRPLRVKLGVDPTTADLHLGHMVVLQKLRAFQDLGHTAVLIIGDFTARVGDPSGRDQTRPILSEEEIAANAVSYQEQAFKILDPARCEVRRNSEWLKPFFQSPELLTVLSRIPVSRLLERDEFKARIKEERPFSTLEELYPVFQGYDSVAIEADVELGGTDQTFNLVFGRDLMKIRGQEPQVVLTVPILVGLDGSKKMSKTYGNAVALQDPPQEMFGRLMSLSDKAMLEYYELLTQEDLKGVKALHPKEAKLKLAETLTSRFHGAEAAREARSQFDRVFSRKELPDEIPPYVVREGDTWAGSLVASGMASTKNEARRLILQGGVRVDTKPLKSDGPVRIGRDAAIVQVGRRVFRRFVK